MKSKEEMYCAVIDDETGNKMEKIYNWEGFKSFLMYLEYPLRDIMDFKEHYQNLNHPTKNFKDFINFLKSFG